MTASPYAQPNRLCSKCGTRGGADGCGFYARTSVCRRCQNKARVARLGGKPSPVIYQGATPPPQSDKRCSVCAEPGGRNGCGFKPTKYRRDGLRAECRACTNDARSEAPVAREDITGAKIILWDIEATNLNANFGFVICVGWKRLGEDKVHVLTVNDYRAFKQDCPCDRGVIRDTVRVLSDADLWVTWYGSRFDVPYIAARALFHKLDLLPEIPHVDLWRTARYRMKLHSNRLASVAAFLGIEEKTPLSGPHWVRAAAGNREAIRYVVSHCKQDVVVLEQAYQRMRGLVKSHPSIPLMTGGGFRCPRCGSADMRRIGSQIAVTRSYFRFRCRTCGAWSRSATCAEKVSLR